MMEYCIISSEGKDAHYLEKKVCDLIREGWTPQGGVFCVTDNGRIMGYVQAMIKMEQTAHQLDIRGWESVTLPPSLLEVDV